MTNWTALHIAFHKFSHPIRGLERCGGNSSIPMESAHQVSSRPDCRSIADVPQFTLRTARSAIPSVSDRWGVEVQWLHNRSSQASPMTLSTSIVSSRTELSHLTTATAVTTGKQRSIECLSVGTRRHTHSRHSPARKNLERESCLRFERKTSRDVVRFKGKNSRHWKYANWKARAVGDSASPWTRNYTHWRNGEAKSCRYWDETNFILDEQARALIERANYEFHLRAAKSESAVQILKDSASTTRCRTPQTKVKTLKSKCKSSTCFEQYCRVVKEFIEKPSTK